MSIVDTSLLLFHFGLQFLTRSIQKHKEAIRRFILQHVSGNDIRILDFGCGEGIFSNIFKDRSKIKYIGVDKDFNSISFAKKVYKSNSYVASNENLCFKNSVFDFVILNNVLHHMNQDEVANLILEIKRLMNKKAFLVIIELAPRNRQKGFFFRVVTYAEEKIRGIRYCGKDFFQKFFYKEFKEVYFAKLDRNFVEYVFSF